MVYELIANYSIDILFLAVILEYFNNNLRNSVSTVSFDLDFPKKL